jgi:alpha-amylase/alpha-mannosidase (GH57 family)
MIPLAMVWHQHQPFYKDLASGEMVLPWVRLHGVKDYYGMARLLSEFSGVKCTVNLVPSMLAQFQDYVDGKATDSFLRRTEIYADALNAEDACFLLDHFFMAQWERMIRVHPRYRQLLDLRRMGRCAAPQALEEFKENDLRDLQVWFNLAWFHPVSFEESEVLRQLREKGHDFSEDDKQAMLDEQRAILARVIPLHQELAARGQIELTTTPYYHPILPLLCDMRSCLEAMPGTPLPAAHVPMSDDAETQVRKAVEFHSELFGRAPEGMWPAEGAVSPDIVPLLARHGIQWFATDEEILSASLKKKLRGEFGKLDAGELLYRAWRCEVNGSAASVLFRDHHLSDLVGFHYQKWEGQAAAADFLIQIQEGAHAMPAGDETLVSVVLDGENCWEHYPEQGIAFLRTLYRALETNARGIQTVQPGEFLKAHPPTKRVEKLFSGSWINHDFYIWVGHAEDRRAWEYLYRTREDLVQAERAKEDDTTRGRGEGETRGQEDMALEHAWEELYIAEGSDWFWWYGDDHNSGNDEAFDTLFRTHLSNVYKFIGQPAPYFLSEPVKGRGRAGRFTGPTASLKVQLTGSVPGYFEWLGAGRYRPDKDGGVMTAAGRAPLQQIFFGYGGGNMYVRVDFPEDMRLRPGKEYRPIERVAVLFAEPKGFEVEVGSQSGMWPAVLGESEHAEQVDYAWGDVLEVKIPFGCMGAKAGQELSFFVEITANARKPERFPRASPLQFTVPPENADEYEWIA